MDTQKFPPPLCPPFLSLPLYWDSEPLTASAYAGSWNQWCGLLAERLIGYSQPPFWAVHGIFWHSVALFEGCMHIAPSNQFKQGPCKDIQFSCSKVLELVNTSAVCIIWGWQAMPGCGSCLQIDCPALKLLEIVNTSDVCLYHMGLACSHRVWEQVIYQANPLQFWELSVLSMICCFSCLVHTRCSPAWLHGCVISLGGRKETL